MAAVVEFLVKMKDGLSGPLEHIADSSKTADTALAHLTKTGEGVKQMADSATGATKKLTESLTNMDALKESMPESVKGGFESIKASLPESVASAFSGVGSLITNPFVIAGAYAKGEVLGDKSFYNDHQIKVTQGGAKEKTAEEKAKEAYKDSKLEEGGDKKADATGGASVEAGLSAVSGGGVKNITVSVNKMIEKLEIHIVGGGQELKQELERIVEETMVRAIASATTR